MVCFDLKNSQHGNGIIDSYLAKFTHSKYPGEHHGYSLDPNNFMKPYNFVGPGTNLNLRDKIGDNIPLNDLDRSAERHDRTYLKEQEEYKRDHNKPLHINNIHRADDVFIQQARHSRDDPIMGNVASKLIEKKEQLEKSGLLDTKRFSGMGEDPASRLRELVHENYKTDKRRSKLVKHNRSQTGGVFPAFLIPVVASVLGALTGKIYDTVKEKIQGKGYDFPDLKKHEKHEYVLKLLKHLN